MTAVRYCNSLRVLRRMIQNKWREKLRKTVLLFHINARPRYSCDSGTDLIYIELRYRR
ncbi:hypothetical protein C0J52_25421 [Blattella germanica]|nr:hypothetical protein C0J52_25421 [Blattella germanica]